jgi:FecR protein
MRRVDTLAVASGFLALLLFPSLAPGQTGQGVGVISTISGQATISRTSLPQPVPLQFKDSVFDRDRISTAENSTVKVLMGGKALVTVRELSVLTITEELGRSTVDLQSGKIALGVVRQRMRPGESIEVKTHNAVAAVRGTVIVVEIVRASAQATGGSGALTTNVHVLRGSALVTPTNVPGSSGITVGESQTYSQIGNVLGATRPLTPAAVNQLLRNLQTRPQLGQSSGGAADQITKHEQTRTSTAFGSATANDLGVGSLLPGGNNPPPAGLQNAPITPPKGPPPQPPLPGCTGTICPKKGN